MHSEEHKGRLMKETQGVGEKLPEQSDPRAVPRAFCPSCDQSFFESLVVCPDDGTPLVQWTPREDPMIGRVLDDRFKVRMRLGAGAMGVVYCAWQASIGREVAIKVMDPRLGHDDTTAKRFFREARLASLLSQPNTVAVYDFGQTNDGLFYLVMERLRGQTLRQILRKSGPFSVARTVRIGVQLCDALEAAHGLGVIHRDLKPSNLFILDKPHGRDLLKVLDFGLAKSLFPEQSIASVTGSDHIVGTPTYMPPEVITGKPSDHLSDLYAVGVILYELISGTPPFIGDTIHQVYSKHLHAPIPPLPKGRTTPQIDKLLDGLLAKKPRARFQSASQVRDYLVGQPAMHLTTGVTNAASNNPPGIRKSGLGWKRLGYALVGLMALSGGIAAWLQISGEETLPAEVAFPREDDKSRNFDSSGEPAAVVSAAAVQAESPTPTKVIRMRLRSVPTATVFLDGKRIGKTPIHREIPRSDTPIRIGFHRSGYNTRRQSVVPAQHIDLEVFLRKKAHLPSVPPKTIEPTPVRPLSPQRPKADFILPGE